MSKVLVIYKSGAQVEIECSEFTYQLKGGTTSVEWSNDANPRPMLFGINEVAAIYEVQK